MKFSGWQVAFLLSAVVWLIPTSGECMKFDETTAPAKQSSRKQEVAQATGSQVANSKSQDECLSYVQVYDSIEQDPEHAGATAITASYAIH